MKIMKYILLTFALFYLNVSIWGQEKSIGITLEDVAGMKEKEKNRRKLCELREIRSLSIWVMVG